MSYEVKPFTSEDMMKVWKEFLKYFFISFALVVVVFLVVLYIITAFPDYLPISTADDLLNIMIQTDGILFGFVGIIDRHAIIII